MAEQEQTVDQQQEKAREKAEDDRYQRAEQQQAAYDDEYESRRETLSALALFQQDAVEQLAGGSRQNRRDYYQKLLSRLYIELRDLGASMLLDQLDAQLTQKHQGKCAMLVYSAVTQCYQMLVLDAPMADAANAVPDVFTAEREPMTWELLASYSADPELPVRASFTTRVRVLRSVSRLLYQARRDGRSAAPEEDALRARLQEYQLMAKMQDESLENAARQVEEANRKAEEARTGRAEEEIKPIKEKLLAEFEEKLKAQEAQFAQAGRAKFQEAFGQQQKAVRERMEDEARWAAQLFDDAGMQYDKLRQDFARMQEEQNARMQQWQTAIYQADTRMLGQCYVGMATKLGDAVDQAIAKLMKPEMSAEEAKPLLELARGNAQPADTAGIRHETLGAGGHPPAARRYLPKRRAYADDNVLRDNQCAGICENRPVHYPRRAGGARRFALPRGDCAGGGHIDGGLRKPLLRGMKNHRKIVESVQAGRSAQYLIISHRGESLDEKGCISGAAAHAAGGFSGAGGRCVLCGCVAGRQCDERQGVSVRVMSAGYGQPRYNDHPRRVGIDGLSARLRRVQRNVRVRGSVSAAEWRTDDVSRHPVYGQR